MSLTDQDYNAFARALVCRFSERAKGVDQGSSRIVNLRPSDHILAGFLTPVPVVLRAASGTLSPDENAMEESDEILADDLPKDSAYEQTAIGMEWIAPVKAFEEGKDLEVDAGFFVFIRRLPTFNDQKTYAVWRDVQGSHQNRGTQQQEATPTQAAKVAKLVPVWTREHVANLLFRIPLAELLRQRKISRDLTPEIRTAAGAISLDRAYPGRQPTDIKQTDIDSPEAFEASLAGLRTNSLPIEWRAAIDVRLSSVPTEPGCVRIALRIINYTDPPGTRSLDYVDPNLYGVTLSAKLPQAAQQPTIFQELPASFRYDRKMVAIGINAQVESRYEDNKLILEVNSVPETVVPRLEPREIVDAVPDFTMLASNALPILGRLREAMRRYASEVWERKVATLQGLEQDEANKARERFLEEIERFSRGVDLLANETYPFVKRAFMLMNEAMHTATAPHKTWHLFQIVFIVSQLPGLAAREYPELARQDDDFVDILWFAAGGGKTEAFLGLIVWQAFFDRLRGKKLGVTALVRFPLRLLTFQQLQRLARALAAAEVIRKREQLDGARFSMGYFVGSAVTPNSINDKLHARYVSRGVEGRLQRVFQCPFCLASVNLSYDAELRLVEHQCTNERCPGGRTRLPVYVVDDDVYRFLPTIIVSTVDKLALFGQNQRFANIFGRFDFLCHQHGVSFKGVNRRLCPAAGDFALGTRPERCGEAPITYGPFRDPAPSLLVQDELHLLSEELGTFDAHYETGVMELMQSLGCRPWKIIAATATIEDYEQQAWQLYLRKSRQFPGPGPEAYESFYYCQNTAKVGRIFVGVLGVGRKHTPAVTRTLSLLYLELQAARELAEQDPVIAAGLYGTGPLSRDEFRQLIFLYELALTYVLTRKGSDQVAEAIESRVKRELQELAPSHGELLIDMFNGGVDIAEMIEAMERIRTASPVGNPAERVRGLVTTNIIGHGVDVNRFNVIIFAGFTRLVAEYIQASARVGRTFPGISIFVATPQSERDRSIFDRFSKFHEYLDRLVDPTAVNRWPEPALSRTVPGLLCGYLMGVAAYQLGKPLSTVENVQDNYGKAGAECLNDVAIVAWITRAYGTDVAPSQVYRERLITRTRNNFSSIVNVPRRQGGRPTSLNSYLSAMRSLRDVDDPAFIVASDPTDQAILKRFING
jgi:Helicase conserved C-terminal domain